MNWWRRETLKQIDSGIEDEFRFHLEQRTADLQKQGFSSEDAARKAKIEFGSQDRYKEAGRGTWSSRALRDLAADTRFAFRMLAKSPAFTIAAVLTLALGIGVTTAIFSLVYGVLYRPLPFPNADRIAMVYLHFSPQNNPRGPLSLADFADWRNANRSFEKVAAYTSQGFDLTGSGYTEQVPGASVTADFFSVLGTQPIRGRTFRPNEDSPSAEPLIVISESVWRRRFGGSEDVIGRVIEVNGEASTIIGVVPGSFGVPSGNIEMWHNQRVNPTRRGPFFFRGIGLLKPGVTLATAQAETNAIGKNIESANPGGYSHLSLPIDDLRTAITYRIRPALLAIFASVIAVMLIAIVNIANLLLARASTRAHEIAVRVSLGASRERLLRQLLTECVVLSLMGGCGGILVAYWGIRTLKAADIAGIPLTYQVGLNVEVLGFSLALSVLAGLAFGLVPALQTVGRPSTLTLNTKGASATRSKQRARSAFVIAEVAMSFVLLISAGLLFRSLMRIQQVDAGFTVPANNVLTMQISPKPVRKGSLNEAESQRRIVQFYGSVIDRLSQMPQVKSASVSDSLPPNFAGEDDTFVIAGKPWSDREYPSTTTPKVSPDYFRVLGVPLIRGRFFEPSDTETSAPVAIISETLAKRYFGNSDPVGQKLKQSGPGGDSPYMQIVGLVGDVKYWGLNSTNDAAYYQVYTQNSGPGMFLLVRSDREARWIQRDVEAAIHDVDKEAVVRNVMTLDEVVDVSMSQPRFRTTLLIGFAALALVLAAIGIYGVIAFSVSQRTRELGVRLALGAPRTNVLGLILRYGLLLTGVGLATGLLLSFATTRLLTTFLFEVRPSDPLTLVAGATIVAMIAVTATFIPALRATRIEPVRALREE
jgi:predicted permease